MLTILFSIVGASQNGEQNAKKGKGKPPNQDKVFSKNQKRFPTAKTVNEKKGRLIIRNLPFKITEALLRTEFSKYGEITDLKILKKPDGRLVGCAFVQFQDYASSLKAIKGLNGKDLLKRKVTVDFAISKDRYQSARSDKIKSEDEEDVKPEVKDEIKVESDVEGIKSEEPSDAGSDDDGGDDDSEDDGEGEDSEEDEKPQVPVKLERKSNEEDHDFTVFVKNLSFDTTNEDFQECFKKYGPIKYALVVRDPISGHSKGTGFVRFLKKESVSVCLQQTGLIQLQNHTLEIFPSLPKQKIKALEASKEKKETKDTRNMYLLREGMVLAGSSAAEGVSATDMSTRLRLEQVKSSMLKNLNRFISRERLTVHNLPDNYDNEKMRKMVIARTGHKPIECRVMLENMPSTGAPKGKVKGFGFLSFKKHEDALDVLRKLNNNPEVFTANRRPIVSFSIEDKNVLNIKKRREERSKLNNPTYQKKLAEKKARRLARRALARANDTKPAVTAAPSKAPAPKMDHHFDPDSAEAFSGFASKPGAFVKMRGTNRLKEQSKIHEKSMHETNKKTRREKHMAEVRKEKEEKKNDRTTKRKIDAGERDNLTKMIDKYKNMIKGNDGDPGAKRAKTRGKWFIE